MLRTPPDARLLTNAQAGHGRPPLLLTSLPGEDSALWTARKCTLERAGARILVLDSAGAYPSWPTIRAALEREQLYSVMVEGGVHVIESLVAAQALDAQAVQVALVTVGACNIGDDGRGYHATLPLDGGEANQLQWAAAIGMGADRVVALVPTARPSLRGT